MKVGRRLLEERKKSEARERGNRESNVICDTEAEGRTLWEEEGDLQKGDGRNGHGSCGR